MEQKLTSQQPWQVAELLEDICKNAEPIGILKASLQSVIDNVRRSGSTVQFSVLISPANKSIKVSFAYPLKSIMENVQGSAEEVVELARTGLSEGQEIAVTGDGDSRCFTVTQINRDPQFYDDFVEIQDRMWSRVRNHFNRQSEPSTRETIP
jgi:hypothetical protein